MKVLIIEDETPAANRLSKMLTEIDPSVKIVDTIDSIEATLSWFENNVMPDLIMMDIHLADGSCFDIFTYKKVDCPIIFTTAYDEYAIQAFKVNAVDYLLKPLKQEELKTALEKFKTVFQTQKIFDYTQLATSMTPQYQERFLIKTGQSFRLVDIKEVAYFYSEDKITYVIHVNGKRYALDFSMDKIEGMVSPNSFFRVNRQFIINLTAIDEMHAHSKSRVKIILRPPSKQECVVSAEKSADFKKWLVGE